MPDPALATGPKAKASGGLGGWARTHKGAAIGAAAVAGVGALALLRRKSKTPAAPSDTSGQTIIPMSTPNSSGQEVLASLQPQIDALGAQLQQIPTLAQPAPTPSTTWGDPTELANAISSAQAQVEQAIQTGQYGDTSTPGGRFLALTAASKSLGLPYVVNEGGQASVFNPATGERIGAAPYQAFQQSDPYLYQGLITGRANAWRAALSGNIPPTPAKVA
jgi:hypothetical protein